MRRLLAIAIAALFGFTLAAPLFVGIGADIPMCCRRNGHHHCAGGMFDNSPDRTIASIAPKCPSFPKATAAPLPHSSAPPVAAASGTPLYAHPASAPQTQARYRLASSRSRQKRGPPAVSI